MSFSVVASGPMNISCDLTPMAETRLYLGEHSAVSRQGLTTTLSEPPKLIRGLSLLDSILLLASGIIGSGIFLTAADIAKNTRTPVLFLSIWVIGMVITILACFAFAEMGAMFPEAGGQYVYLREAYGNLVAFLYGWMIFTVSVGGTIAALGAGFAQYAAKLFPALSGDHRVLLIPFPGLSQGHFITAVHTIIVTREHL